MNYLCVYSWQSNNRYIMSILTPDKIMEIVCIAYYFWKELEEKSLQAPFFVEDGKKRHNRSCIAGALTSTPGLATADSMVDSNIPSVAYATVYPIAMVFLILFYTSHCDSGALVIKVTKTEREVVWQEWQPLFLFCTIKLEYLSDYG